MSVSPFRPLTSLLLLLSACATTAPAPASSPAAQASAPVRPFGTLREQAERQQAWLRERLDTALPQLMRREGIAWLSSTHKSIEEIATTILRDIRPDRLIY